MLSPSPRTADSKRTAALEKAVSASARLFDPTALLDVLDELGYRDEDIVLRSRHGTCRPSSLIDSVAFETTPKRRVLITVNLGLLGSESPLPSYFQKLIEHSPDRLVVFFEFFDHSLLRSRFRALWPERDHELGCDWGATRRSMSKLVRLDAPSMAHWLFRRVYPELEVSVRRAPTRRTIPTDPVTLGKAQIGDGSALGGETEILCGGLSATLVANEPRSGNGAPWQEEAARRMRAQLLPQILDSDISLTVTLIIRDRPSHLQLLPSSFLGLQPLQRGDDSTKVLIFDGPIQDIGAPAAILGQKTPAPAEGAAPEPPPKQLIQATTAPVLGSLPEAPSPDEGEPEAARVQSYLARLR
jgi:hypothetical protein